MAVKLNNSNDYEPIKIVLTKEQYPIAYNNKVEELVEEGCYNSKEECEMLCNYLQRLYNNLDTENLTNCQMKAEIQKNEERVKAND